MMDNEGILLYSEVPAITDKDLKVKRVYELVAESIPDLAEIVDYKSAQEFSKPKIV